MNIFSRRILASSDAMVMMSPTIKWRIPSLRVSKPEISDTEDQFHLVVAYQVRFSIVSG